MQGKLIGMLAVASATMLGGGCGDDSGSNDTGSTDSSPTAGDDGGTADETADGTAGECVPATADVPELDESACTPAADDYTPTVNASADDTWPACANDDGGFHPFEQPGSAARVEAWEQIRTIFAGGTTADHFTAAREQYSLAEGIESRAVRREDVHYPNIDEADQDPTIDFDKQCTIESNVTDYPDRCAGPAKIAPIINEAFDMGQTEAGDPAVNAARIDAAIAWFMYLSIIKEATFSCPPADFSGDCDAAWGYYNGATERGAGLGLASDVAGVSEFADERVYDGIAAMRCWRDAYPADMDADVTDPLYVAGADQLDRANNHAAAVVLRQKMIDQPALCGSEADANWNWVQVFGQSLEKPAQDTDAAQAAALAAVLENNAPSPEDVESGVAAIDALFPCP